MTTDHAFSRATVYVVDDDASVRESLSSLIRSAGMAVKVFASPLDFLELEPLDEVACLVLDVRMPGLDGLSLQKKLLECGKSIPIIFITGHGDVPLVVRAMKMGAIDFLKKPFKDTDLLDAIASALSRASTSLDERSKLSDLRRRFEMLTPREKEVVLELALGKANKRIAFDHCVTESTVKVHKHNAMRKMGIRSTAELTLAVHRLKQQ